MARSQNSFMKKQKAQKKKKKREEKLQRKIDKKFQETNGELENMLAYVDEKGNIVDEPPEDLNNKSKTTKNDESSENN